MAAVGTNHPQQPQLSGSYCDDDPIGSFSHDPIGFAAGDANLYRYVGNGPVDSTDPSGLEKWGHHWVPLGVSLKLLNEGVISYEEYKYFAGMSSGDCNHRGRHDSYSRAVEAEVRKWKNTPKRNRLSIDDFLDRIREGRGVDGEKVPAINDFLEKKVWPHFPVGEDGKRPYDPDFNEGAPDEVQRRGRQYAKTRKHPVDQLDNIHGLGLAFGAIGLLGFAGQGAEAADLIKNSPALKYAQRNPGSLDVLENCLIGSGPGNGNLSLAGELEVQGHAMLARSIRAAVISRLAILRAEQLREADR